MNENLTMKVADQIPFVAVAPDEICRINADGTTTYHWDRIEAAAQRWTPGCADIAVCLAKLLLPLRRREWQGLTPDAVFASDEIMAANASLGLRIDQLMDLVHAIARAEGEQT